MDWLRSALNDSDSEGTIDNSEAAIDSATAKTEGTKETIANDSTEDKTGEYVHQKSEKASLKEAGVVEGSGDHQDTESYAPPPPLFSLTTTTRKVEDYSRTECVKINPPKPTEDPISDSVSTLKESQGAAGQEQPPKSSQQTSPVTQAQGALDTLEIMQRFNMTNSEGQVKAPKRGDWFGTNIRVTDINADDLRMGKTEKSARYSTSKEALLEGRSMFKAPARQLETDDGQLLVTNVMRKTSKRKHQISWLAADAQEQELELLERTAQARKTKHETQMKYGW
ncbi:uncharacterized protein BXIN_1716 [Babesia sp. Xinjiang]|uniref:uncharacterized protein n=1 Tax=Babesia sp. Xinjiang TaxID=462227 RepID=UPI000A234D64|nr:uncharacterized protein BXIN_1707 [Babesia sp. Xinjiang]XP_028871384.1 uncharacterized protein BXIN_1716 [Babesia sp. Xinjiang]ORM40909.1 hypothetical protein BXIN_1707 [Babesia sp. Xinjiang]ORM40928.1 hypothetical protein BXIN_1716 [Babesia sp. Xinjiang]